MSKVLDTFFGWVDRIAERAGRATCLLVFIIMLITTFDVTATFVATGTGTAYWTSEEYKSRYSKPTGLRVCNVKVGGAELEDWIEEGAYVYTNQEDDEVDITYVQSVTTTTLFPPHFTKVLAMALAIEYAFSVIQSATMAERLRIEYDERILPKAIALDERGRYVQESSSSWQDVGHNRFQLE